MDTSVDMLYKHYESARDYFTRESEVSLLNDFTNNMRKVLLLSCGSYFEKELTELLKQFVSNACNSNEKIIRFMYKQAIAAKYHTLFDWGKQDNPKEYQKSAKKFYKLFGDEFAEKIKIDLENEEPINNLQKTTSENQ